MDIKLLKYNQEDNITGLVKCLEEDKEYLRNIPHKPGEFSNKPFKLTTTCLKGHVGDYYDYYKESFQLATCDNNIITKFSSIKIIEHENVELNIFKVNVSIHKRYNIKKTTQSSNLKGIPLIFVDGIKIWGVFMQDYLPYLLFMKEILDKDKDINIYIINENRDFDSFNYIIKNILNINNNIIYLNFNTYNKVIFKTLYEFQINGPFSSGLFPYIGHCTCPVVLYKNLRKYIANTYLNNIIQDKPCLIYTMRNTGNKTRNIINEHKIINILEEYCKTNNLQFIKFFYKDYPINKRFKLFYNAKIVIGPHGSANFHTLFCNNDVNIIEYVFIKDCHSTQLVNLSYGFNYWQIPVHEYGQYEKNIQISNKSINSMITIINKLV